VTARGEGDVNDTPQQSTSFVVPFGLIEPHAGLLIAPPEGQSLYKMMTVENLLRSIAGSYLHFNRVDAYQDLDPSDGAQVPGDQSGNALATFVHDVGCELRCCWKHDGESSGRQLDAHYSCVAVVVSKMGA
jgi:hypothetical protein